MQAFLRAEPDVIVVGVARQGNGGHEASLAGHLLFSTQHTNSARSPSSACWTWAWTRSTSRMPCLES
ncbi:Flp pilus assembly complex ATPase component TadA [Ramlibacter monticola]|uniref:Flp pilus assembly complex ATPase component TadA n=1 Tax=Ramlibacter monticola TaxID=1926872 RepID=A0A936Z434_9BURK|nr:ATPase, T2SS/T4P/T4SS family [Ramlibacter monticola]MBL0394703.1 Flp pilus assembly complex ATPase component TadA [Ramlibacter monticola]